MSLSSTNSKHAENGNNPSGPTLIFIHGWLASDASWEPLIAKLSPEFSCVSYNLRPHWTAVPCRFEDLVNDLNEVVISKAANENGCVLIGASMGALLAWELASRKSADYVVSCVSFDQSPKIVNDATWAAGKIDLTYENQAQYIVKMKEQFVKHIMENIIFKANLGIPQLPESYLEFLGRYLPTLNKDIWIPLWEEIAQLDFRKKLENFPLPALAIHGEKSGIYDSEKLRKYFREQTSFEFRSVKNSGHNVFVENSEECANLIKTFIFQKLLPFAHLKFS